MDPPATNDYIESDPNSISTTLLERVKAQDPEAWRRLVRLYSPIIYRWYNRWKVASSDIPDLVQEVFRAVAGGIAKFRHDSPGDSFRGWLWTIARNQARDYFTDEDKHPHAVGGTDQQVRLSQIPEQYPEGDDESEAADDRVTLLYRAVQGIRGDFEERTWQAFMRTSIEGGTAADIADELGMTKGAVRQAKHRVLQRLREEFGDLID